MNVTPKDIYDAYPESDLLALEPPEENETFAAYRKRMGGNKSILACGDTLFAFLLFEAADEAGDPPVEASAAGRSGPRHWLRGRA